MNPSGLLAGAKLSQQRETRSPSTSQLQGGISSPNLAQWALFLASNRI